MASKKAEVPSVSYFDEKAVEKEVGPLKSEAERVRDMALKVRATSHDSYMLAADGLLDIAERVKQAEARRDSSIGLIKKGLRALEAVWRAGIKPYDEAEDHLRAELGRYAAECEKRRDEDLRKAATTGDRDKAVALIASAEDKLAPKIAGIGYRGGFEWKVIDFAKLPAELKKTVADEDKIAAIVKAQGLATEIPGVIVKDGRSVIVSTERRAK
jgi:hypothetical protein